MTTTIKMVMEALKIKHKYKQRPAPCILLLFKRFHTVFFSLRLHPTQSRALFFGGPDEVQAAGKVRRQGPRKDHQRIMTGLQHLLPEWRTDSDGRPGVFCVGKLYVSLVHLWLVKLRTP